MGRTNSNKQIMTFQWKNQNINANSKKPMPIQQRNNSKNNDFAQKNAD